MIKPLMLLLLTLCLLSGLLAILLLPSYSISICAGVGLVFLANAYFIIRVFGFSNNRTGNKKSGQMVPSFMSGSMGKLSIASVLFALLFIGVLGKKMGGDLFSQPDQAFALMLGFFSIYLAYIVLVAVWLALKKKK